MKVHIIFCNDAPMAAVVDDEVRANFKLETLAQADFERDRWRWEHDEKKFCPKGKTPYQHYRSRLYWHVHTVEGE